DDNKVHLVFITSPTPLHSNQTISSIQAGKDVVVEIPVSLSFSEADRVARRSAEAGCRVLVCHTMRSFPAIREVRRRVQAGELNVRQIAGYFAIPRRRNQSRGGQRNWTDNLLWHHGCHMIDAALWVLSLDEVEQVNAIAGKSHDVFGMLMDLSIHFRTPARQV